MTRSFRRCHAGFSRIDLVAVTTVVILSIAAALPAVYSAGTRDDKSKCMDQMRRVSQAVLSYELVKRRYPGYSNVLMLYNGQVLADPSGQKRGVSWVVPLLSFLDQAALDKMWKTPGNADVAGLFSGKGAGNAGNLPLLICPADKNQAGKNCGLSYVANCGMPDSKGSPAAPGAISGFPRDYPENGVFFDLFEGNPRAGAKVMIPQIIMSNDFISRADGAANTCLLSENVDAGAYTDNTEPTVGMIWYGAGTIDTSKNPPSLAPRDESMRIAAGLTKPSVPGKSPLFHARPSSPHLGGVNMAFCDGRIRFVRSDMDYYVYCLLMSTYGARVRLPGTAQVLPGFDKTPTESWYLGK